MKRYPKKIFNMTIEDCNEISNAIIEEFGGAMITKDGKYNPLALEAACFGANIMRAKIIDKMVTYQRKQAETVIKRYKKKQNRIIKIFKQIKGEVV